MPVFAPVMTTFFWFKSMSCASSDAPATVPVARFFFPRVTRGHARRVTGSHAPDEARRYTVEARGCPARSWPSGPSFRERASSTWRPTACASAETSRSSIGSCSPFRRAGASTAQRIRVCTSAGSIPPARGLARAHRSAGAGRPSALSTPNPPRQSRRRFAPSLRRRTASRRSARCFALMLPGAVPLMRRRPRTDVSARGRRALRRRRVRGDLRLVRWRGAAVAGGAVLVGAGAHLRAAQRRAGARPTLVVRFGWSSPASPRVEAS